MNTDNLTINGHALYATKGAAREYGRIGCNFYTGCPHGCVYCYLKRGITSQQLGGTEVRLKKCFRNEFHAADVLQREMDKWIEPCRKYGIFLSFTTDPMLPGTQHMTVSTLHAARNRDIPVWVLTKCADFIHDSTVMAYLAPFDILSRLNIHFGFTLTGHDGLEPNASSNSERIMAMSMLDDMGFMTFASLEPVIDWKASERMVRESVYCCDHYKIGLRSGVKKDYYNPAECYDSVKALVDFITRHGRTVYLKESVRKLIASCAGVKPEQYQELLSKTVDMDGQPWCGG